MLLQAYEDRPVNARQYDREVAQFKSVAVIRTKRSTAVISCPEADINACASRRRKVNLEWQLQNEMQSKRKRPWVQHARRDERAPKRETRLEPHVFSVTQRVAL